MVAGVCARVNGKTKTVDAFAQARYRAGMSRNALLSTVQRLWPEHSWTKAQTGNERVYRCLASPYEIFVEWSAGNSAVTLVRNYNDTDAVSVTGASTGSTAEGIRRAFMEAQVAWMLLQKPPKGPSVASTPEEVQDDYDYLKGLARVLNDNGEP